MPESGESPDSQTPESPAVVATQDQHPAPNVFISYASQDTAVANAIVEILEGNGLRCWIAPRDVMPGSHYADGIMSAINGAKALVLVLSGSALASKHVGKEVERASSKGRPIIALRTDATPLTPAFEYFLSESQWIDVGTGGVAAAAVKLAEAVKSHANSAVATGPVAAPIAAGHSKPLPLRRSVILAVVVVFAGLFGYLVVDKFWLSNHIISERPVAAWTPASAPAVPIISEKSIAVLPFVDMSEKKDQEYFSDGLSEELIDHLAHNADLKVIARTSSFAFKGKNEDVRSIATKLGVANLLEGSVRKAGSGLRITAQLIRASDGVHLWSEVYDRKLSDIFKVQDEISATVARALNVALNAANVAGVQSASKQTTNIEAYNLVLRGNYFFDRGNQGDNARAVEIYQQALKLDPHYALAWAKLARVYAWQGGEGELTAVDAVEKVRNAVERALSSDPNCAAAYYARGNLQFIIAGDWTLGLGDYERTVALDPHGEMGERAKSTILVIKAALRGQLGELLDEYRRYLERNPLDADAISNLAGFQQFAGHLEESAATSRRLLELNPAYAAEQAHYGLTLLLMGKKSEALAAAQKETDEASKLEALSCVYWATDRRAESESALGALERGFGDRNEYLIASAHACRGETDSAFKWLDRAYQHRRGTLFALKVDPLFHNLRDDPRFNALLRKAKLLE